MLDPKDILFAIPIKEIARICLVDVTTARRWKKGAQRPPEWALALLHGDLGFLDPTWTGWRLIRGDLVSPENWIITRGDVLAQRLVAALISTYQVENRRLKAELAAAKVQQLEEQPTPDSLGEIMIRIG